MKDFSMGITIGPWGGIWIDRFPEIGVFCLNLGFIGLRFWRGDFPDLTKRWRGAE